jgi:secreted PhoX family phosphatase
METEGALRGTSRLFFRCPTGAELCGPCFTPDLESLFVAVQHPGESEDEKVPATAENPTTRWPDFKDGMPPRPSIIAITRKGGGKIGV